MIEAAFGSCDVDQKDLGVERYDAGRDYLAALRDLRLEPEALFWGYDKGIGQLVLVLVSSGGGGVTARVG